MTVLRLHFLAEFDLLDLCNLFGRLYMTQLRPHDLQLQNVSVRFRAARADILYVVDLNAHAFDRAQQRAERHAALELTYTFITRDAFTWVESSLLRETSTT